MITFVPGNGVARKMQKPEFLTKISEFFWNPEFFWDLSFFENAQKKSLNKPTSKSPRSIFKADFVGFLRQISA